MVNGKESHVVGKVKCDMKRQQRKRITLWRWTTTFRETDLKFLKEAPRDRENIGDNLKTRTKETSTFAEAVKKNLGGKLERSRKAEAKAKLEIGGDVTEKGQVVVSFISKANCEADKADIVDSHQMGNRVKEKEKLEEGGERTISETLFTNGQDKGKKVYVRKLKLNPWSVFVSSVRSKLDEEMWLKCVNGMLEGEYRRKGNDKCRLSLLGPDSGPIQDSLNHDDGSHEGPH
ncbi:hypothetical protein QYF36_003314 [Acer negundo]|nr:hypothetical protein QYF36_003314 [Acer negundo]